MRTRATPSRENQRQPKQSLAGRPEEDRACRPTPRRPTFDRASRISASSAASSSAASRMRRCLALVSLLRPCLAIAVSTSCFCRRRLMRAKSSSVRKSVASRFSAALRGPASDPSLALASASALRRLARLPSCLSSLCVGLTPRPDPDASSSPPSFSSPSPPSSSPLPLSSASSLSLTEPSSASPSLSLLAPSSSASDATLPAPPPAPASLSSLARSLSSSVLASSLCSWKSSSSLSWPAASAASRSSAPSTRSLRSTSPYERGLASRSAPRPRSFLDSMAGLISLKRPMRPLAALDTSLSRYLRYSARSCNRSSFMTSGARMHSSRTVLRPIVMTSGRARSCTNASTSCRNTGCSVSGGTTSWHAITSAANTTVTSRWCDAMYFCRKA
mmetsp:Transcript_14045/g.40776  ORF Transcript_14045/g.40776 Transcript_14045/m.40776 type:complete len:389 (-) Transcript_14045:1262-2428(-)